MLGNHRDASLKELLVSVDGGNSNSMEPVRGTPDAMEKPLAPIWGFLVSQKSW